MKTKVLIMVGAVLMAAAGVCAEIQWAKTYAAAQKAAKAQNKLIMVDFYTDWCSWCKKLDADTYPNAKVVAYSSKLVSVKVDAEKEGVELAKRYKVQGYPTILFLDANGEIFGEISGYMPPTEFLSEMTKINDRFASYPALAAKLKTNPDDGEANAKMVPVLAAQRKVDAAKAALDKAVAAGYKGEHLAKAYNAVGDAHQTAEKYDDAIGYFSEAMKSAKQPSDKSYALMSIMYCHLSKGEMEKARASAKELIAMPGAPKEHVDLAKELLKQLGGGG